MTIFFELISKKIGFSRIGRFPKSKYLKKHLLSPHLLIPINKTLMKQFNFIKEFYDHETFVISDEKYLKKDFLLEKFKNSGLIYNHSGTLDKFWEILEKRFNIFKEYNILTLIPFNIPTMAINREFAEGEIDHYLQEAENILLKHPHLNIGLTIKIFDYPELIVKYIPFIKKYEQIKILSLADLFDNFGNYRGITKAIVRIKQELDNNIGLLASGRIIPKHYPILVYLGIDVIDASYLLYLSSENFYDTIEFLLPIYKIKDLPCSCIACRGRLRLFLKEKYSPEKIDLLCLHNLISAKTYINKINQYLKHEDFRAFVEKSALDDINIISLLRILDKEYFEIIRYETPVTLETKPIKCFGPTSYHRPDFSEFRKRIVKNFEPEESTSLLLLLPCSAKKPYSESKSHKRFFSVIRKFPEFPGFQEIILTSPLGAIPRQLENVYPVNSYDIPVTGDWDEEELNIAANMLIKVLEKYNPNIPIICHLEGGYLEIAKRALKKINRDATFSDIYKNVTSKESLQSLEALIQKQKDIMKLKETTKTNEFLTKTWHRKLVKILDYQFGIGAGSLFAIKELETKRNRSNTKIELINPKTHDLLGVFKFSTGQMVLTSQGGNILKEYFISRKSNILVFNGESIEGNTLFRAGVIECSPKLCPNDYIIVLNQNKDKLVGVGQLFIGSHYFLNSKTGRIAKIVKNK